MARRQRDRSRLFDIGMIALLLGSVVLVFVYEALDPQRFATTRTLLLWLDLAVAIFFVSEWLWRVRASRPHAARYAAKQSWELLGMIPLILPVPAGLRALRLLRVVRILRVFKTIGARFGVWERIARDGHLKPIAIVSGSVTLVGATLVWLLERQTNPDLASFGEALWWAVVTVTTVGYGDITPGTIPGRFIAGGLMIAGIGTIGLLASTLANAMLSPEEEDKPRAPVPVRAGSIAAELQALGQLHSAGQLTDEEFEKAKNQVLS